MIYNIHNDNRKRELDYSTLREICVWVNTLTFDIDKTIISVKLSKLFYINGSTCIRTSNFDLFRRSVKTMLFTQQYGC